MIDKLKVSTRLAIGFGLVILLMLLIFTISQNRMSRLNSNIHNIEIELWPSTVVANSMLDGLNAMIINLSFMLAESDPVKLNLLQQKFQSSHDKVDKLLAELIKSANNPDEQAAVAKIQLLEPKFNALIDNLQDMLAKDQRVEGITLLTAEIHPLFIQYLAEVDAITQMKGRELVNMAAEANESYNSASTQLIIILVIALGFAVAVAFVITRSLAKALGTEPDTLRQLTSAIAAGDFNLTVPSHPTPHSVLASVVDMLANLKQAAELAVFNARIRAAVENANTNIMIADNQRKIIYLNKGMERMLRQAEADFQKVLPQFRADAVLNSSMDSFHKNPAHQASMLEHLRSAHKAQLSVGARYFDLCASPVFGDNGEKIGTVAEWIERTIEINVANEINEMVSAAANGDFTKRLDVHNKEGFFLDISKGLNQIVDTSHRGLADICRVLGAIADGDLTQQVQNDYQGAFAELKEYCNKTTHELATMLGEIRTVAEAINTAASEISQGNTDLSSRTEEQASSLEETASSMEELTGTVRQNADNARQANTLAAKASEVAMNGGHLIEQVVTTMASINESAQKIADIIGVIDGIAFQTNILALNAAVEAARAGEQGRGFAVVASEVRTLAQRSANAAKDIKALISDSVGKISNGNDLVGKSGDTMKDIVVAIKRVNDIMAEIAAASAEQANGLDEVGRAVTQMDEMTQQNAALVEQSAAAAESMLSQAEQLSSRVSMFKINAQHHHLSRPQSSAALAHGNSFADARDVVAKTASKPAQKTGQPTDAKANRKGIANKASKTMVSKPQAGDDEWESF